MSTSSSSDVRKPLAERLVQEALVIVATSGPTSLSLREVQRRANVSPAAAYRHFHDRDDLLLAVSQEAAGLLADCIAAAIQPIPASRNDPEQARRRLLAACEGYLDFAVENPGLYRAIFYSHEQIDELAAPPERARGEAGDGGFNLLVGLLDDVVAANQLPDANPWDPVTIWSTCHGLAALRLDAALRSLAPEVFAQARTRVLQTITAAVPLETVQHRTSTGTNL